jgi:hypothetical protein
LGDPCLTQDASQTHRPMQTCQQALDGSDPASRRRCGRCCHTSRWCRSPHGRSHFRQTPCCSFCSKSKYAVQCVLAGSVALICDECIDACMAIAAASRRAADRGRQEAEAPRSNRGSLPARARQRRGSRTSRSPSSALIGNQILRPASLSVTHGAGHPRGTPRSSASCPSPRRLHRWSAGEPRKQYPSSA